MSTTIDMPGLRNADRRQMVTAVVCSSLGWSLDLFDLFILLYVAPVVGRLFFPASAAMLSLAAVYASFAVTLLMRPVGAALFGSYADRHGRKRAMMIAVIGVGVSTAAFGVLPTVAQAGVLAPVLFLALRLVQGLLIGGVVASTHTIGTESVPETWRGAVSGLVGGGGSGIAALLASLAYFAATSLFPGPAFAVWGWRCMFFSGVLTAVLGVYIYRKLAETPLWAALDRRKTSRPPVTLLFSREYRGVLLVNILLTTGAGAGYYLTSGYLPAFLKIVLKIGTGPASGILIAASLAALVSAVSIGHLSSFWGRRRVFIVMGCLRLVVLPVCFWAMVAAHHDMTRIIGLAVLLACLGNGGYAPLLIFLNERFPTAVRSTGTGLSWNIGFAIGGMMPALVSLAAPGPQSLPMVLGIFLFGVSIVFLAGALIVPETRGALR